MLAIADGPLVEEDVGVYLWRSLHYGERPYVQNLCALPAELENSWCGRYMGHEDALSLHISIIPMRFSHDERSVPPYWPQQVRRERRTLSDAGQFVPYDLMRCNNLRKTDLDRLLV